MFVVLVIFLRILARSRGDSLHPGLGWVLIGLKLRLHCGCVGLLGYIGDEVHYPVIFWDYFIGSMEIKDLCHEAIKLFNDGSCRVRVSF